MELRIKLTANFKPGRQAMLPAQVWIDKAGPEVAEWLVPNQDQPEGSRLVRYCLEIRHRPDGMVQFSYLGEDYTRLVVRIVTADFLVLV